ncbi:hypothetical protein KY321_03930 [Candidatus Woesearchaeota archaeon]|nr:hypothetical protein [Candidatus Woesearchaeota archaeon]
MKWIFLLIMIFLVGCGLDITGNVGVKREPFNLTIEDLDEGVLLEGNWDYITWPEDLEEVSVETAFESIKGELGYVYQLEPRLYYFNPDQKYSDMSERSKYERRVLYNITPGYSYAIRMVEKANLTYSE